MGNEAGGGRHGDATPRLTGQFNDSLRVVAFNIAESWSRDVSEDVARAVVKHG